MNQDFLYALCRTLDPETMSPFMLVCWDWYSIGMDLVKAVSRRKNKSETDVLWLLRYHTCIMKFPCDDNEPKYWSIVEDLFGYMHPLRSIKIMELRNSIYFKSWNMDPVLITWIDREKILCDGSGYMEYAIALKKLGHYKTSRNARSTYLRALWSAHELGQHMAFKMLVHRYKRRYTTLRQIEQTRQLTPDERQEINRRILWTLRNL